MDDWTPRSKEDLQESGLELTPEEGFLLSRLDGATTMAELASLTGETIAALARVVARLVAQGAVHDDNMPAAVRDLLAPSTEDADADAAASIGVREDPTDRTDLSEAALHPLSEASRAAYQQIFVTTFKELNVDQRVAAAERGGADELCALCFDPSPRVIAAVLQNVALTAIHARMIARNHGTRAGLDRLGSKPKLLHDKLVQRALLRNRWCSDELCTKVLRGRSMNQLYLDQINADFSDVTRRCALRYLRQRFTGDSADAKAALVIKSEGRCLRVLGSLPLDERTVAILCRRTALTTLLVQNFAKWPPTPPTLLRFLAKHQLVRRNQGLRNRLLKHPNCPSDTKRS